MLIAKTVNDERIEASEAERHCDKGDYICPRCENSVHTRKGPKKIDHFAHYPDQKENCEPWEPETEEHREMKKKVEEYFSSWSCVKEVEKEKYFDGPYPDLLVTFYSGELMAVECQHSKITEYKIRERTERLEDRGATVLWIFDYRNPGIDYYWSFRDGEIQRPDIGFSSPSDYSGGYKIIGEEIMQCLGLDKVEKVVSYSKYKEIYDRFKEKKIEEEASYYRDIFESLEEIEGEKGKKIRKLMTLFDVENINSFYYLVKNKKKIYRLMEEFISFMKETSKKQKGFLLSIINDVEKLDYEQTNHCKNRKPRLFYKKCGGGCFFLDFRGIGRKQLKPDFYWTKDKLSRNQVLMELEKNCSTYTKILKEKRKQDFTHSSEFSC